MPSILLYFVYAFKYNIGVLWMYCVGASTQTTRIAKNLCLPSKWLTEGKPYTTCTIESLSPAWHTHTHATYSSFYLDKFMENRIDFQNILRKKISYQEIFCFEIRDILLWNKRYFSLKWEIFYLLRYIRRDNCSNTCLSHKGILWDSSGNTISNTCLPPCLSISWLVVYVLSLYTLTSYLCKSMEGLQSIMKDIKDIKDIKDRTCQPHHERFERSL